MGIKDIPRTVVGGYIKVARTCEPYNLFWLEIDSYDPEGLRLIRDRASMPIASCESLYSRRQFRDPKSTRLNSSH